MVSKITIGIDCDDVLLECNSLAIQLYNGEHGTSLSIEDITAWDNCGNETDKRLKYFGQLSFFKKQKALPGAREFLQALIARGLDVLLITAVSPVGATQRFKTIREEFPFIPEKNIIIGSRKDVCNVDILLDDAPHNVFNSTAKYPVLMRRPWNHNVSGILSVNGYDEMLTLVDRITFGGFKSVSEKGPYVVALVGPSGSGKTAIATEAAEGYDELFAISQSTTTRARRDTESEDAYHFVDKETFANMKANNEFIETTVYAENCYGMERANIDKLLKKKKNVIIPLDMCGALTMKSVYGSKAMIVFVKRPKDAVLKSILERKISDTDKYNRIISLEDEYKNESLCDFVINNSGTITESVDRLIEIVK